MVSQYRGLALFIFGGSLLGFIIPQFLDLGLKHPDLAPVTSKGRDNANNTAAAMAILKDAYESNTPIYRMTREQLDAHRKKILADLKNFKMDTPIEQGLREKLEQRHKERLKEIERKKKEQEEKSSKPGHYEYFVKELGKRQKEIENSLNCVESSKILTFDALRNELDNISKNITALEEFTAHSKHYIRDYDVRKSIETICTLQKKLEDIKNKTIPLSKFSFGDGATKDTKSTRHHKNVDVVDSPASEKPSAMELLKMYMGESLGFSDRIGETLVLDDERMRKDEVELSKLEDCTVKIIGAPSTLHITHLKNCKVFSGPVATSVFIEGCEGCTFLMPCQQLRIHNTKHCDFYIHITSRGVIENTSGVRFAPFNWHYDGIDEHFKISGLSRERNNWDSVDDFTACTSGKQSQNWSLIQENERLRQWD